MSGPVSLYNTHGVMCTSKSDDAVRLLWLTNFFENVPSRSPANPKYAEHYQRQGAQGVGSVDKNSCDASSSCPKEPPGSENVSHAEDALGSVSQCKKNKRHTRRTHPAVRALTSIGYRKTLVNRAKETLQNQGIEVSPGSLLDVLQSEDGTSEMDDASSDSDDEADERDSAFGSDIEEAASLSPLVTDDAAMDISSSGGAAAPDEQNGPQTTGPPLNDENNSTEKKISSSNQTLDDAIVKPKRPSPSDISPSAKEMLAENRRLKLETTCKICLDADVTTLFLPCRHLASCQTCADKITHCPLCRMKILGTVQTYLS